ncbi:RDD family protein [Lolliginicoccus suaedae]|uniref:RDD family protein n=1 Tax=Lolliginicoccus suaedae TaxID=2605429 RepID=UPI0011EDA69E|nr:RDD family protein [Lolliginicoccus suaedae]
MPRNIGSWLYGPSAALPEGQTGNEELYRGESLGLPEDGPGSTPTWLRRSGAFFADIIMAALVAGLFTLPDPPGQWSLLLWFAVAILAVFLFSFTPGQAMFGLRVQRAHSPAAVGLGRAIVRSILVFMLIPAAIWDRDGRGLHDRVTDTVVVRTR